MMLVTNSYSHGVPMPLGGPTGLAVRLLAALEPETLYLRSQVLSRLSRAGCAAPESSLEAALVAGWLREEASGAIGYASRSWLPVPRLNGTQASSPSSLVSFFKPPITNVFPYKNVTLADVGQLIRGPRLAAQTQRLRSLPIASEERKRLKTGLPSFTPGGTFTRRANRYLVKRSGLLGLDFDHEPDLLGTRACLLGDSDLPIELLFTSPSGDGLKVMVRVPLEHDHQTNFWALSAYLRERHGLIPDPSGKDVARACFACHDPGAWLHPVYRPLSFQ